MARPAVALARRYRTLIGVIARANLRCSTPKRSRIKRALAVTLGFLSKVFLDSVVKLPSPAYLGSLDEAFNKIIGDAIKNAGSELDMLAELNGFVNREIRYAKIEGWLPIEKVLSLGIGDCRNQSRLLHELCARCGIKTAIAAGILQNPLAGSRTHAWVEVRIGSKKYICDPTIMGLPMSEDEFRGRIGNFTDYTPEYRMIDPLAIEIGFGSV